MFMSDVNKQEEIRTIAFEDIRKLGVKCRLPKKSKPVQVQRNGKLFRMPLSSLPTQTVTLRTGQQIAVPKVIHEMCAYILKAVETEGLFRKEGSKQRQNDIKSVLMGGGSLNGGTFNVLEVSAVLKTFLRDLPDPLIPFAYHELFLRSVLLDTNKLEALLLVCLLLPSEHLTTLSYLMQFFHEIAEYSSRNKMTPYNLAVCIGPTVFPIEEKFARDPKLRTSKTCELFELLIVNAGLIGVLPETIIERVGSSLGKGEDVVKKKKRRSGSLTRMFNGLKKIVGGKSEDNLSVVTPDLLLTPINRCSKKRKLEQSGLSNKKKKELLNKLPDNALLNTQFTPCRTPVNFNLNGDKADGIFEVKGKKSQWYLRSKSTKNLKTDNLDRRNNAGPKSMLERRWSAVSQVANLRRNKKRSSCIGIELSKKRDEHDYVRVPKVEYEEIKNRVSAIERRISIELENVQCRMENDNNENNNHSNDGNLKSVQIAYEETLVQAKLSPTTDQLAKRLSRELKIRRSGEQKIVRSPSARKIGSMRRRSLEKVKIVRHQSWHVGSSQHSVAKVNLKRGQPNTVQTGLPSGTLSSSDAENKSIKPSCNLSGSSEKWTSAEGFFGTAKTPNDASIKDRASLAKLRSQNAGMVLAKARLFDGLTDSSSDSANSTQPTARVRAVNNNKIGSTKNADTNRMTFRGRNNMKYDGKMKKSMSPRRRNANLNQRQKLVKHILDFSDKENVREALGGQIKVMMPVKSRTSSVAKSSILMTSKLTPVIKKSLNVRSPKRLNRTPGLDRSTPLKVFSTPFY